MTTTRSPRREPYPVYRVQPRDTLRSIALRTLGDAGRAEEIVALNRDVLADPPRLFVGQDLLLPRDARSSPGVE